MLMNYTQQYQSNGLVGYYELSNNYRVLYTISPVGHLAKYNYESHQLLKCSLTRFVESAIQIK